MSMALYTEFSRFSNFKNKIDVALVILLHKFREACLSFYCKVSFSFFYFNLSIYSNLPLKKGGTLLIKNYNNIRVKLPFLKQ